jgi:peptide-methionine (R)-S-oxide reductase
MGDKISKSNEEWKNVLTPEQYRVTREKGTEPPFTGEYDDFKGVGVYRCVCCGNLLFRSTEKFDSGTGWPSFWAPVSDGSVIQSPDEWAGLRRLKIECARCGAHLGHLFEDGPQPTGLRYCTNSVCFRFEGTDEEEDSSGESPE